MNNTDKFRFWAKGYIAHLDAEPGVKAYTRFKEEATKIDDKDPAPAVQFREWLRGYTEALPFCDYRNWAVIVAKYGEMNQKLDGDATRFLHSPPSTSHPLPGQTLYNITLNESQLQDKSKWSATTAAEIMAGNKKPNPWNDA